ncbi:MAG TPA: inositol monophosphatase [Candidatus Brachybacterium merdigallinarum]|nr:inositol monophosphatase [Candidatus Brachybacterium merdigallinarum]
MNTTDPRPDAPAPDSTVPAPAELLEIAVAAAHRAAEHLRSLDRDDLSREYKTSSHDIVTEHDRACEEMIVAELRRRLPSCRIVGEEGGERPAEGAAGEDVVSFYVDPIDGTSNFAAGMPLFCVSIGVTVGEELVAGVIDAPVLGQVFAAADGPALLNGTPIHPRDTRPAADALVLSGFPTHRSVTEFPEESGQWATRMASSASAVRHLGTAALELAYVAAGWADATALPSINSWDIAAGFHILRRAGGSIRTWPGHGPVDAPDHLRPAYVACTGQQRVEPVDALFEEVQAVRDAFR